ncbi:MAG: hypothetical protein AAFY17_00630 [Cyanobacteria bacterium J06642_11]
MGFVRLMKRMAVPFVLAMGVGAATASAEELSLDELYKLCSAFPFNSRCEGFELPVPLDQRNGTQVNCGLDLSQVDPSGNCRMRIDGTSLIVYAEEGDPIEPLDNQKGSREIQIPFEHIFATALRIWDRETDATSFLIGGDLYIQRNEAEYDGFERDYVPGDEDEREGRGKEDFGEVVLHFVESPDGDNHRSNILRITATEEFGAYLLEQLPMGDVVALRNLLREPANAVASPRQ